MANSSVSDLSFTYSSAPEAKSKEEEEAEGREKIVTKYKHKLSTLPKAKWWTNSTPLYNHQGFWYLSTHGCSIEGVLAAKDTFKAGPTDIILATNPKCGTTWLKALAFAILNRTKLKNHPIHPLLVGNPHDYVPFIEIQLVFRQDQAPRDVEITDPQLLATHMPYVALPESIHDSGCRVVYICREAKDVFISRWFFSKKFLGGIVTFEEAFDMFCKGVSPVGPYWEHVLGYYKASLERPGQVLFLKYEEMKKDTTGNVKRLAEFLGRPFSKEEEAEGVVEEVIQLCSFEKMRSLEVNKTGLHRKLLPNEVFFREGKVGDSVNHLTPQMIETIDRITREKFHGYDLWF